MDTDAMVLEDANAAVIEIDVRYRESDINGKLALKGQRDAAYNNYSAARLKLLEDGMLTTEADVTAMRALRQDVERAADQQQLLISAGRLVGFLARFAV